MSETTRNHETPRTSDSATAGNSSAVGEFSRQAEERQPGIVREFTDFLLHNKKWWLAPIIVMLLLISLLVVLAGTGAAPFIYTLF